MSYKETILASKWDLSGREKTMCNELKVNIKKARSDESIRETIILVCEWKA